MYQKRVYSLVLNREISKYDIVYLLCGVWWHYDYTHRCRRIKEIQIPRIFTVSECYHSIGHLKLFHRDGIPHSIYHMICSNGLSFHTYNPLHKPTPKIKLSNNSCHSDLWYWHLGCAGNNITDNICTYVIGIKLTLQRNSVGKCLFFLPNQMTKRSIGKSTKNMKFVLPTGIVAQT